MRNSVVLVLVVCLEVFGNICLSHGMRQVGPLHASASMNFLSLGIQIFSNLWILIGLVLLLAYFIFFLTALSRMELSYVLPMTASSYVLTAFMAWGILGERISVTRWIGTWLICMGILLVKKSEGAPVAVNL